MRQVCNIAFMAQVEIHSHKEGDLEMWERDLNRPPVGETRPSALPPTRIDPALDSIMGPDIGPGGEVF